MFKSLIVVMLLSIFLGLFAGIHLPHIRTRQAVRELCSKRNVIDFEPIRSSSLVLLNRQKMLFAFNNTLSALDAATDNCLERLWFPESNSIKTATNAQLYVISTFDENYQFGRDYVFHKLIHRHYREGREIAGIAMALRGPGEFHNTWREAYFASALISLGLYSDAEKVLKNLLPVEMTTKERDCPHAYRVYRQELFGQVLLGQHKYQEAAEFLERQSQSREVAFDSLSYYRGIALLALHRDEEALRSFNPQKNNCPKLFIELCSQEPINKARKDRVMALAVRYSEDVIGASDDVPALELAVDVLRAKGFNEAASEVAKDIRVITQN